MVFDQFDQFIVGLRSRCVGRCQTSDQLIHRRTTTGQQDCSPLRQVPFCRPYAIGDKVLVHPFRVGYPVFNGSVEFADFADRRHLDLLFSSRSVHLVAKMS